MTDRDGIYFGRGTTPERVAEAVEQAKQDRERGSRPRPTTAQREAYFARIAELRKQAEAGS